MEQNRPYIICHMVTSINGPNKINRTPPFHIYGTFKQKTSGMLPDVFTVFTVFDY